MVKDPTTTILLTSDEALIFKKFMKHHEVIGYLVGYMESLGVSDIKNTQIVMDVDQSGIIGHMAITRHYRK